jgi:hypothetical protein
MVDVVVLVGNVVVVVVAAAADVVIGVVVVDVVNDGGGGRINGPSIIPITLCSDIYTARDPARSVATIAERIANPLRILSKNNILVMVNEN